MKIFFISYWGVKEGLSVSTVYPNIQILSEDDRVEELYYFSVERSQDDNFKNSYTPPSKVQHIPIQSVDKGLHLFTKISDVQRIKQTLRDYATKVQPDLIICRGAMAGIFGYQLYKAFGFPYLVESFEPHAAYMLNSGTWSRYGIKYNYEMFYEQKMKETARFLVTVSNNYAEELQEKETVEASRVHTVPCYVQLDKFVYNQEEAQKVRKRLGIDAACRVGVCLGKYGEIYYDEEAFKLFRDSLDFYEGNFFLLLLTPMNKELVEQRLNAVGFPLDKVFIDCVPHSEVPGYLSAADFAYSLPRETVTSRFCSPIKNGEYWSVGLPIVSDANIGDDSDIMQAEGGGAILENIQSSESNRETLKNIESLLTQEDIKEHCRAIAKRHRALSIQREVYSDILANLA